ncbi:hypothetical protein, partial [Arthrobacter sp. Hiyo1]|uniref:hypothetical protein n=1 Tax=Arthrobacter sp. Hiyo1 TaxID=1588020 RepID=UPI001C0F3283
LEGSDDGVHVHVVGVLMGDQHRVGACERFLGLGKVPGSITRTWLSFCRRTQAWVNLVSFMEPA